MNRLGIVVPCFNEESTIPIFYETCQKILRDNQIETSYYFVDDGSTDGTLSILRNLSQQDPDVHYVSFSRNFGKEAAMLAGLEATTEPIIVTMDVDLQDPPDLVPQMWNILAEKESVTCVATRRSSRKGEPKVRSWFAKRFYHLVNKLSSTEIVDGARDFRMMRRIMVEAIIQDKEYNRFSKGINAWVGFETEWISYENVERSAGNTKWSFWKLVVYALDGILAYSTVPLAIVSMIGCVMFVVSLIALLFVVIRALVFGDPVAGWPSLVSIVLFLGSTELLCMGIIGLYISKMYLETKKRQIYIIKEKK